VDTADTMLVRIREFAMHDSLTLRTEYRGCLRSAERAAVIRGIRRDGHLRYLSQCALSDSL
jgi:hypothetical protein